MANTNLATRNWPTTFYSNARARKFNGGKRNKSLGPTRRIYARCSAAGQVWADFILTEKLSWKTKIIIGIDAKCPKSRSNNRKPNLAISVLLNLGNIHIVVIP